MECGGIVVEGAMVCVAVGVVWAGCPTTQQDHGSHLQVGCLAFIMALGQASVCSFLVTLVSPRPCRSGNTQPPEGGTAGRE